MIKFSEIILKSKKSLFFAVFLISFFSFLISVDAQTSGPQFLVSWQAQSLAPAWYQGKIFPTLGSRVTFKFDLIDGGKPVDLSKKIIRWYVNDNLVVNEKTGLGIRSYSFVNNEHSGSAVNVRISIPEYKTGSLDNITNILIASPETVISVPYADKKVKAGILNLEAIPFFFKTDNRENLSFKWTANEKLAQTAGNSALNLNIEPNAPKGSFVDVSVFINNIANELEYATRSVKLEID